MDTSVFNYQLPEQLIAQEACEPRDAARLLVAERSTGDIEHRIVRDLPSFLRAGDLLVLNRTRVIPARLFGHKPSGGELEVLLIHPENGNPLQWRCLIRGKVHLSTLIVIETIQITVIACHDDGERTVEFPPDCNVLAFAERVGHMPLPPYIKRSDRDADRERYQTVFGDRLGSVAAPTASLHLTTHLLQQLTNMGVDRASVELAIGPGTFKPVNTKRVEDFRIHAEHCSCPQETVDAINACHARGGRVIAVGTTVVRTLETAAESGELKNYAGWTRLFMYPPRRPIVVDGLLTNFHLPQSSLLMLVACFTGVKRLHQLYNTAIQQKYRFFSYGDAMLLLPEASKPRPSQGLS